jgi:Ankyrin repeats (3 copies)
MEALTLPIIEGESPFIDEQDRISLAATIINRLLLLLDKINSNQAYEKNKENYDGYQSEKNNIEKILEQFLGAAFALSEHTGVFFALSCQLNLNRIRDYLIEKSCRDRAAQVEVLNGIVKLMNQCRNQKDEHKLGNLISLYAQKIGWSALQAKRLLHAAACYGKCEIVKLLLNPYGAEADGSKLQFKKAKYSIFDPNDLGFDNMTPLHWACASGSASTVQVLLDNNAQVDVCNRQGRLPLDLAIFNNYSPIIDLLPNKDDNFNREREEDYPLDCACEKKNPDLVKALINKGAWKCDIATQLQAADDTIFKLLLPISLRHLNELDPSGEKYSRIQITVLLSARNRGMFEDRIVQEIWNLIKERGIQAQNWLYLLIDSLERKNLATMYLIFELYSKGKVICQQCPEGQCDFDDKTIVSDERFYLPPMFWDDKTIVSERQPGTGCCATTEHLGLAVALRLIMEKLLSYNHFDNGMGAEVIKLMFEHLPSSLTDWVCCVVLWDRYRPFVDFLLDNKGIYMPVLHRLLAYAKSNNLNDVLSVLEGTVSLS